MQLALALIISGSAAVWLGWRSWQVLRGDSAGCGDGCQCSRAPTEQTSAITWVPVEQLHLLDRE